MILVPEEVKIIVDRHVMPVETLPDALDHLEATIKRTSILRTNHLSSDDHPTPHSVSMWAPDANFTRTARAAREEAIGQTVSLTIARSVADVDHIAVYSGIPTSTAGPWGGNMCEANERVDLDALLPCARMHVNTILCMLLELWISCSAIIRSNACPNKPSPIALNQADVHI